LSSQFPSGAFEFQDLPWDQALIQDFLSASSDLSSIAPFIEALPPLDNQELGDLPLGLSPGSGHPVVPSFDDGADILSENMLQPSTAGFLGHSASPLNDMSLLDIDLASSNIFNMAATPGSTTCIQQSSPDDRLVLPAKQTPSSSTVSTKISSKTNKRSRPDPSPVDSSNSAQDSEEERMEKRRRNTMAARRFRQRKQDHVADLKERLDNVTKERDDLRLQVAKWEGEVMALRKLLDNARGR
jgi:hypothetical protein